MFDLATITSAAVAITPKAMNLFSQLRNKESKDLRPIADNKAAARAFVYESIRWNDDHLTRLVQGYAATILAQRNQVREVMQDPRVTHIRHTSSPVVDAERYEGYDNQGRQISATRITIIGGSTIEVRRGSY